MRIADILAIKGSDVATIPAGATVADAVRSLADHKIGALVVSPDADRIDGILSERDIVRLLNRQPEGFLERPVGELMTEAVYTCGPDSEVASVMATMTARRIRHLPVVADGHLAGIVSIGDVVKHTIEQLERDRKLLEDYIGAR